MRKLTIALMSILFLLLNASAQNVGISTTAPDAKLDVVSTTSGVLIPRVLLTSKNVMAPVVLATASELVYNSATDGTAPNNVYPGYYYWSGTPSNKWIRLVIDNEIFYDWIKANTPSTPAISTEHQYVTGDVGIGNFAALTPAERLEILDGNAQITSSISGQIPTLNIYSGDASNGIIKNTNQKGRIDFWEPNGKGNWGMYIEHFDDDGTFCPSRGGGALLNHLNLGSVKGGVYTPIISLNDGNTYSGRVGIGTTDPEQELHIVGTTRISTLEGTNSRLILADNNGDLTAIANGTADQILISNGTILNWQDGSTLDDHDWHKTNGTTDQGKATTIGDNIYTNGNVGIGSVKPNVSLYVMSPGQVDQYAARFTQSNTGANGISTFIGLGTEDDYYGVWSKGAIGYQRTAGYDVGDITFNINSAADLTSASEADEKMRITSGGNIGIGNIAPDAPLTIGDGANSAVGYVRIKRSNDPHIQLFEGTTPVSVARIQGNIVSTHPQLQITSENGATSWFNVNHDDGKVGIGSTSPRGVFDVAKDGDIYLSSNTTTGTGQSLYLPGHIYMSPYNGSDVVYLQARRSNTSGSTQLEIRTTNSGSLSAAATFESNGDLQMEGDNVIHMPNNLGYVKYTSTSSASSSCNCWQAMTSFTNTINVESGDNVVVNVSFDGRFNGGSGGDDTYFKIYAQGASGCGGASGTTRRWDDVEQFRNDFMPFSFIEVFPITCNGTYQFRLEFNDNLTDDSFQTQNVVITAVVY